MHISPFIPCDRCKESATPGFIYTKMPNEQIAMIECECHKKWKEKENIILKATQSNIWHTDEFLKYCPIQMYKGTLSRGNIAKLNQFIMKFNNSKFSSATLYMHGIHGTQKTYLGQWIGLSLIRKGFNAYYTTMNSLIKSLIKEDSYTVNESINYDIYDCLIIDESFSKDKVTLYRSGYQLPYIEGFIRERIEQKQKATIFISNSTPYEIMQQGFSESLQNFIVRVTEPKGTILEFKDEYFKEVNKVDIDSIFSEEE